MKWPTRMISIRCHLDKNLYNAIAPRNFNYSATDVFSQLIDCCHICVCVFSVCVFLFCQILLHVFGPFHGNGLILKPTYTHTIFCEFMAISIDVRFEIPNRSITDFFFFFVQMLLKLYPGSSLNKISTKKC